MALGAVHPVNATVDLQEAAPTLLRLATGHPARLKPKFCRALIDKILAVSDTHSVFW
jgi:hypothetical protein